VDVNLIETLLQEEEQSGPVLQRVDLEGHRYRRAALDVQLSALHEQVQVLYSRYHKLPRLADTQHLDWAEALSKFPNLAIAVLDTTGVNDDSDIIRVMIGDLQGEIRHDWLIRPVRQPGYANTTYTGIDRATLAESAPLTEIWAQMADALAGQYVLAYNLDFLRNRLRENAIHYNLEPVTIIGECLMERAKLYYNHHQSLKLTDVCAKIGRTLPRPATAKDRILGQIAFLNAIREGVLDVNYRPPVRKSREEELNEIAEIEDEHPF
jgi:hypothetical protein